MRSTIVLKLLEVILFEETIALIRILEKLPLGGQNADFMLLKLNNRLVNHFSDLAVRGSDPLDPC